MLESLFMLTLAAVGLLCIAFALHEYWSGKGH